MRLEEGIIEELEQDGKAKIRISGETLFVACEACAGAEGVHIRAVNGIGASVGDRVRYEVPDRHLIMGAFMCFGMPLILAAVIGFIAGGAAGSVGIGVAGALLGLVGGVYGIRTYDRSLGLTEPTILSIVDESESEEERDRVYREYATLDVAGRKG